MRTYRKVFFNEDFTKVRATDSGTGVQACYAISVPKTKSQIVSVWNFFAGINTIGFGGPTWAQIDFNPPFNARILSTWDPVDLASQIFTYVPYPDHDRN